MTEGITEIWHITFFCLTMSNPQCAALHGHPHGSPPWSTPWKYFSERQCVSFAEDYAEEWYNKQKFQVEYSCDLAEKYVPYVATRRIKKEDKDGIPTR
jgi:hypothetical protein